MLRGILVNVLHGAVALLACVSVGQLTAQVAPMFVDQITPKAEFFARHKDEFDTLFVGTSRVFHGVSPKVFDETAREQGCPTHSFNAAADALASPESLSMVRRLVALHPRKLKRVFLEITDLHPVPRQPGTTAARDIYWQDWTALKIGAGRCMQDWRATGFGAASDEFFTYFRLFARNQMCMGRGVEWISRRYGAPVKDTLAELGPSRDGFFPMSTPMSAATAAKYHAGLEETKRGYTPRPPNPVNRDAYARLRDELGARGIEMLLIATPTTVLNGYGASIDSPQGAPLLVFNNPAQFPELYEDDNRLDYEHLNEKGATQFSRMLAREFSRRSEAAR